MTFRSQHQEKRGGCSTLLAEGRVTMDKQVCWKGTGYGSSVSMLTVQKGSPQLRFILYKNERNLGSRDRKQAK